MHSIYCYSANINQGSVQDDESNNDRLSPPIILIGTHRNSLTNLTKKMIVRLFFKCYFYL